jgi:hypothetical protein
VSLTGVEKSGIASSPDPQRLVIDQRGCDRALVLLYSKSRSGECPCRRMMSGRTALSLCNRRFNVQWLASCVAGRCRRRQWRPTRCRTCSGTDRIHSRGSFDSDQSDQRVGSSTAPRCLPLWCPGRSTRIERGLLGTTRCVRECALGISPFIEQGTAPQRHACEVRSPGDDVPGHGRCQQHERSDAGDSDE